MEYQKTFPDMFSGKKIMYVHGFASSAQSGTVGRLRSWFPNATILAYDAPVEPHDAIAMLKEKCALETPDLIIGTSMGGMFAEQLRGFDRILINPAFQMADTMAEHGMMGKNEFLNARADGVKEFYVDKPLVKRYREVTEDCFQDIEDSELERVFGLFGDKDPLVHTFDLFKSHYPNAIRFHGEHRMDDKVMLHYVVPVMRWIDDRQQCRDRKVVFFHIDAMRSEKEVRTENGTKKEFVMEPSCHKAYEYLLENYQVYIVADAPSYAPAYYEEVQKWVDQECSAPAFNHLIFSNNKSLLYGDYFIDVNPDKNFMGTALQYRSSEFKTWEEIITYFERLGGQ